MLSEVLPGPWCRALYLSAVLVFIPGGDALTRLLTLRGDRSHSHARTTAAVYCAHGYSFWVLQCTIVQFDVFADRVFP